MLHTSPRILPLVVLGHTEMGLQCQNFPFFPFQKNSSAVLLRSVSHITIVILSKAKFYMQYNKIYLKFKYYFHFKAALLVKYCCYSMQCYKSTLLNCVRGYSSVIVISMKLGQHDSWVMLYKRILSDNKNITGSEIKS